MSTLILVGPTASGKTGVAHVLARRHPAVILSADALMVYRGMDIGTAKPSSDDRSRFNYRGLDICNPNESFSVHDYVATVRGDAPGIVVGGTGLYIRGLLEGLDAGSGAHDSWRARATGVLEQEGFPALKSLCLETRPSVEDELPAGDRSNPRRWIRAVERSLAPASRLPPVLDARDCVVVGLQRARADLHERIHARVEGMFSGGLLDEVRRLRAQWGALSPTAANAIGYAEAGAVIDGTMTIAQAKLAIVTRTRQYAKRQMTWFRHQLNTHWIDAAPGEGDESIAARVDAIWHG